MYLQTSTDCSLAFLLLMRSFVLCCRAEAMYQSMKTTYGVNACHLLQINSRSPTATTATPPGGVAVRGGTDLQPDNIPNPWAHFVPKSFTTSLQVTSSQDVHEEPFCVVDFLWSTFCLFAFEQDGDMDEQKVDCETYPSDKTNTGEAVYDRQPDGAVVRDANPEMTTDFNNRIDSAAELTEGQCAWVVLSDRRSVIFWRDCSLIVLQKMGIVQ